MAKQKAKIKETFEYTQGSFRRMYIVSCNGQSQVYYNKKEARAAKAAIEKGA